MSVSNNNKLDSALWEAHHEEGQLAVDVAETEQEIVVISTLAGALTNTLEVFVHNDLLTIRGQRKLPPGITESLNYFHKECFWGKFSRTIVLPVEVKGDLADAEYKNGILIIRIPKERREKKIPILIVEE
jgi:HSP20 family protein